MDGRVIERPRRVPHFDLDRDVMGKELAPSAEDPPRDESKPEAEEQQQPASVQEQLAANLKTIEKAVRQKETRALFGRLLRQTAAVRKSLTAAHLLEFVQRALPHDSPSAATLRDSLAKVRRARDRAPPLSPVPRPPDPSAPRRARAGGQQQHGH